MKGGDGIRVMVSGLGAITSIGNSVPEVLDSLRTEKSGIKIHPELGRLDVPVKLAGVIEGFEFPSHHSHTWKWPGSTPISREALRSLPPHGVYAWLALVEAIRQADLTPEDLSNGRTGLLTASAGSSWLQHENMRKFLEAGPGRSSPFGLVSSIAGTLTFNLAAAFEIRGVCGGVSSACASSAQALGYAWDQIVFGRADRIIVIGAEDCDSHTILPFAAFRAVTTGTDPNASPCAFDEARDGFAATGGAAVVILESDAALRKRGREGFAELRGWGCAGDGHHPMAPEPDGTGILQSVQSALRSAQMETEDIDYLNAHAPLTPSGDAAEARAIDQASPRKNAPLVTINCAALPANLIESECFGHERGAFTGATTRREGRFAQADGGTIFLDEIGELPLELQAKLLRVLQEGTFEPLGGSRTIKVDVRVIAATHRDLSKMVAQGSFREDLYFRLNVFPIHVPPLRERSSDIEFLAREFC
jgi:3-oxoacyl-[acyl-carrier-protein] synthase-1